MAATNTKSLYTADCLLKIVKERSRIVGEIVDIIGKEYALLDSLQGLCEIILQTETSSANIERVWTSVQNNPYWPARARGKIMRDRIDNLVLQAKCFASVCK